MSDELQDFGCDVGCPMPHLDLLSSAPSCLGVLQFPCFRGKTLPYLVSVNLDRDFLIIEFSPPFVPLQPKQSPVVPRVVPLWDGIELELRYDMTLAYIACMSMYVHTCTVLYVCTQTCTVYTVVET